MGEECELRQLMLEPEADEEDSPEREEQPPPPPARMRNKSTSSPSKVWRFSSTKQFLFKFGNILGAVH